MTGRAVKEPHTAKAATVVGELTVLGAKADSGGPGGAGVKCLVMQHYVMVDDRADLLQWEQAR